MIEIQNNIILELQRVAFQISLPELPVGYISPFVVVVERGEIVYAIKNILVSTIGVEFGCYRQLL